MQTSEFSDEEWQMWIPINYVFNVIKNMFFGIAFIIKKDTPKDGELINPFDDFFDTPLSPHQPNHANPQ